jgi:DNA-binding PadR family transcriptional regulator
MRRGEIRTAVLGCLAEGPGHGYEVMQRLEEQSGGTWRPSPGSVYPTLQQLHDEGLVTSTERDGKRIFEITDAGREELEQRTKDAGGASPWATVYSMKWPWAAACS